MSKKDAKVQKDTKKKKPHYKKKQSGVYNKKPTGKKSKNKNRQIDHMIETLVAQAQQAQQVAEVVEPSIIPVAEPETEIITAVEAEISVESPEQSDPAEVAPDAQITEEAADPKQPMNPMTQMMVQAAMAGAFVCMGLVLLLSTLFFVYFPTKENNEVLADERLASRMELSLLISDVFPSMKVEDELSDLLLRSLENRKNTLQKEGNAVVKEINGLKGDEEISKLLEEVGYSASDFDGILKDSEQAEACLNALQGPIGVIDARLEELGVAKLKEDIAALKGATTTVTREDENGQTITETVTTGGLIPEVQAKKNELQKKFDDIQAKLDQLDAYIHDNQGKINAMYNRLEDVAKVDNIYTKIEAITAYAKANPEDNIFLKDTEEKLASFPGESKEEDDILFIMKVESETGIRMQTINYGQDYQHKQLSNGMLLCYEVYSIPYYATYQGLKNLIAYFNDNDDFYGSVYTLSMQYNPANESIQGSMVILHYYLLEKDAEYVPPVIDEEIIPGIDGIFGDVTDNGKPNGPLSNYTPEQIEEWLDQGLSLEDVRKKLTDEQYPETELLWILKKKYKSEDEIIGFLEKYGDPEVDYNNQMEMLGYLQRIFPNTELKTLLEIYNAKLPEDTTGSEQPDDPEDTTGGEQPEDPEDTTGGEQPEDPEDTTGGEQPEDPESGKLSDYTVDNVKEWMGPAYDMSLRDVREKLKGEGYEATELAWILHEEYKSESEILAFMLEYEELDYLTLEDATELFECSLDELKAIYRS